MKGQCQQLRRLLDRAEILLAPGVFCPLVAKAAVKVGFEAIYVTGYGTAGALLGQPDAGLATLTEMVSNVRTIVHCVDVPVISDADTGYGDVANVARTVLEFENAGAAGIHIEDKVWPRDASRPDAVVIPVDEMADRIRVAVEARQDEDFVIIARTDARYIDPLKRVIERCNLYVEAGADMIFLEHPRSMEELRAIPRQVKAPVLANMCEGYKTPFLSAKELEALGFDLVIFPISTILYTAKAMINILTELKRTGTTKGFIPDMLTEQEFDELVGMDAVLSMRKRSGLMR